MPRAFLTPFSRSMLAGASCLSFVEQGFAFGDPEDHFHRRGHPHEYRPEFATCPHCTPPVHGECVLLRCTDGECNTLSASDVIRNMARANRRTSTLRQTTHEASTSRSTTALLGNGAKGSFLSMMSGRAASRIGLRKVSSLCQSSVCMKRPENAKARGARHTPNSRCRTITWQH